MEDRPKFILSETEAEYHARSKSGEVMSSHMLAKFRESPILYKRTVDGLIPETKSDAYRIGSAAHKLILEGRAVFDETYLVSDGPVNPKTGESYGKQTKAYSEWASNETKLILSRKEGWLIETLANGVFANECAMELLEFGIAEGVVRADYCDIPCQIRMDWFHPVFGIVDLKTCDELKYFESDANRYGYLNQMSFYRSVLAAACGEEYPVHIIAVEKKEPYSCGVWEISKDALNRCAGVNYAILNRLKDCRKFNIWPTGYESVRILD